MNDIVAWSIRYGQQILLQGVDVRSRFAWAVASLALAIALLVAGCTKPEQNSSTVAPAQGATSVSSAPQVGPTVQVPVRCLASTEEEASRYGAITPDAKALLHHGYCLTHGKREWFSPPADRSMITSWHQKNDTDGRGQLGLALSSEVDSNDLGAFDSAQFGGYGCRILKGTKLPEDTTPDKLLTELEAAVRKAPEHRSEFKLQPGWNAGPSWWFDKIVSCILADAPPQAA